MFVLMLENRSFDHMLGFSGITETDTVPSSRTSINGLTGLTLLQLARSRSVNSVSRIVQRRGGKWPPPTRAFGAVLGSRCRVVSILSLFW